MQDPIIELTGVGVSFGSLDVHRDINIKIYPGETVTIIGPSGIGKTLILKMIIGLLRPTKGSVKVLGRELQLLDESQLREVRKDIGMLFQGAALFDSLNVKENIAYSLREFGEESEEKIDSIVAETLAVVALPGIQHKYPPELSGGQKKRVGLARALASHPKIMLFDEPTTGLDPTAIRMIDELIIKLREEYGMTSIAVTHDIESARRISDRWLLINNGRVAADGPVEQISRESKEVTDFISGNWQAEIDCLDSGSAPS